MAKRFLVLIALLLLGWFIAGCSDAKGPPALPVAQMDQAVPAAIESSSGATPQSDVTPPTAPTGVNVVLIDAREEKNSALTTVLANDIYIQKALYTATSSSSEPVEPTKFIPGTLWADSRTPFKTEVYVVIIPAIQQSGNQEGAADDLIAKTKAVPVIYYDSLTADNGLARTTSVVDAYKEVAYDLIEPIYATLLSDATQYSTQYFVVMSVAEMRRNTLTSDVIMI